ncbi:hypothetical protein BpHYR1_006554 [Brachionus plicatilis]|uniref:Uncharacterized protein n=1 Tax=Brachionus plicatilis TaxID=10195 RepID=A0A3M7SZE6_BRAPC|nr:hypothetical protein BpHYR1_006554 [Brachionus plicatilis]
MGSKAKNTSYFNISFINDFLEKYELFAFQDRILDIMNRDNLIEPMSKTANESLNVCKLQHQSKYFNVLQIFYFNFVDRSSWHEHLPVDSYIYTRNFLSFKCECKY